MVETAGTKLRRARTLRQMSIEDAARATKIRPRQIADLEGDEYSNFANLAYARGFFVGYAKFLRVDVQPYLEAFEDTSTFGLDDYQYLSEVPVGVYRAPFRPLRRRRRKRTLLTAAMTLTALTMALMTWYFVLTYRRLGPLDKLAARQEAREHGAPGGNREAAATLTRPAVTEATEAAHGKPPAAMPLPAVEAIPVSVPVPGSAAPSPVPANDKTITSPAALAAAENATAVPVGALAVPPANGVSVPAVPVPGVGAARALTQGGPDLHAALAGVPAGLNDRDPAANAQAKIRVIKPGALDPYRGNVPQTVSNDAVR